MYLIICWPLFSSKPCHTSIIEYVMKMIPNMVMCILVFLYSLECCLIWAVFVQSNRLQGHLYVSYIFKSSHDLDLIYAIVLCIFIKSIKFVLHATSQSHYPLGHHDFLPRVPFFTTTFDSNFFIPNSHLIFYVRFS